MLLLHNGTAVLSEKNSGCMDVQSVGLRKPQKRDTDNGNVTWAIAFFMDMVLRKTLSLQINGMGNPLNKVVIRRNSILVLATIKERM